MSFRVVSIRTGCSPENIWKLTPAILFLKPIGWLWRNWTPAPLRHCWWVSTVSTTEQDCWTAQMKTSPSGIPSKLNQCSLAGPFKHTLAPFIGILDDIGTSFFNIPLGLRWSLCQSCLPGWKAPRANLSSRLEPKVARAFAPSIVCRTLCR